MDMGSTGLGTMLDTQPDEVTYPTLYLRGSQVGAIPGDGEVGDERMATARIRISEIGSSRSGGKHVVLEILELTVAPKEQPTMAERAYPSMLKA